MPFSVPTQASIVARVKSDFRTEAGVNPLRRSPELALLMALAGQSKGLYSFLEFIFKQCSPVTAEESYGWRWAAIWDIVQRAATPWQGVVRFTGTNTTLVPTGTQLSRSDGVLYETTEDGTISGGQADIPVQALEEYAGADGNLDDGDPLVLAGSISGIDSDVEVQSTTIDGADDEDWESEGLPRLLQRISQPPSGGVASDYVRWALEIPGVTRAWATSPAPGTVRVTFVRDNDSPIVPDAGEIEEVRAHVQEEAPITVEVEVPTLTALPIEVEITDLDPDTSDVRDAIEESLEDFFYREVVPGESIDISRLREAISAAAGESSHTLVSPTSPPVVASTEVPVFDGLVVS